MQGKRLPALNVVVNTYMRTKKDFQQGKAAYL